MLPSRVIPFADPSQKVSSGAARPQLVQIGRDWELLRLRAKIIDFAGYPVHSVLPEQATREACKVSKSRVWVLCHTLEFYELALLAVAIRNSCPSDKLLRLTGLSDIRQPQGLFDELVDTVQGVDELLLVVERHMNQRPLVQ